MIKNLIARIRFFFEENPKKSKLLSIFLLLVVIPLTVIIAQKQQETRQRAADFCKEVTEKCPTDISLNSTCDKPTMKCRLGDIIVECREQK